MGDLSLTPGDSSEFKATFTIPAEGYYQFDLTDLSDGNYVPGHIYAAGFLRVQGQTSQGILGAKVERETSSTSGFFILISLFASLVALIFFVLWKRRRNKAVLL